VSDINIQPSKTKITKISERVDNFVQAGAEGSLFRMRLHEGAKKRFITEVPTDEILRYLDGTVNEIYDAVQAGDYRETFNECADLINWANALMHREALLELRQARANLKDPEFEWPKHRMEP
jgi:hypothetical protein